MMPNFRNPRSYVALLALLGFSALEIVAECGGSCMCATCHIYVEEEFVDLLPEMEEEEDEMLEGATAERKPNSRLGCQVRATKKLDGLIVRIPDIQ